MSILCMCVYACMCTCVCVCMRACVHVSVCMHACVHVSVCTCVCLCVRICPACTYVCRRLIYHFMPYRCVMTMDSSNNNSKYKESIYHQHLTFST